MSNRFQCVIIDCKMIKVQLLWDSKRLFWRFKSSISCWCEEFLRRMNCMYSAAFFSICALLTTFSLCSAGTESLRLEKLSLMWSLRLRSNALWCARFSAYKYKEKFSRNYNIASVHAIVCVIRAYLDHHGSLVLPFDSYVCLQTTTRTHTNGSK